jgi:hypothetical protein
MEHNLNCLMRTLHELCESCFCKKIFLGSKGMRLGGGYFRQAEEELQGLFE